MVGRLRNKSHSISPSVIKEILSTYNSAYTNDDLLALYSYTGGVAEYVEMMMDAGATTKEQMTERFIAKTLISSTKEKIC